MASIYFLIGCALISAAAFTLSLTAGLAVTGILLIGLSVVLAQTEPSDKALAYLKAAASTDKGDE